MKTSIYDRIASIETEDLSLLLSIWQRLIADRITTPKHDYYGKCALRATLILESRGAFSAPLTHSKTIRRHITRRIHE